jgi:outer membrane protein assembly factor BamD
MRTFVLIALAAALALTACAGKQRRADAPPEELYRLAQAALEDRDYEDARKLLDQIRDQYPFSRYAVDAELLGADIAFREKKYEEAAAAYRSFEELHPTHEKAPYALYRRGLSYEATTYPADRDQTATRNAVEAFQKLLYANPDSPYAVDARKRLAELRGRLAEHELYVAKYYLRKKQFDAALQRLQELVREYPEAPQRDDALRLALELQSSGKAHRAD